MARKPNTETSTATIGFEARLPLTGDKLRNNMDAAEYTHFTSAALAEPLWVAGRPEITSLSHA